MWGGVPQGTNFGPIIFSAVANDSAIDAPLRWKYVDDLTLGEIVSSKTSNDSQLQKDLNDLGSWCKEIDMQPKPKTCHIMHISLPKTQLDFQILLWMVKRPIPPITWSSLVLPYKMISLGISKPAIWYQRLPNVCTCCMFWSASKRPHTISQLFIRCIIAQF